MEIAKMLLKMNLPLKILYQYIVTILLFKKIKSVFNTNSKFDLSKPTASDINKRIQSLDTNIATGPNGIPAKFVQMSVNAIDFHISNIITCDILKNKYCKHAEIATVRSIFKNDDRTKIKNYQPVSLLNI